MSEYSTAPIFSTRAEKRVRDLAREEIVVAARPRTLLDSLRTVIAYLDLQASSGIPTDAPIDLRPSLRSLLKRIGSSQ